MSDILQFLQQRNSAPKLTAPAPSAAQMEDIFRAALRAPDHAWLRPWRFITIAGERRVAFGELLEQCLLARTPDTDEAACTKARNAPLRAPLLVVVVIKLSEHPKVPAVEQRLSGACAAQAILLAAESSGFAGIWRTGPRCCRLGNLLATIERTRRATGFTGRRCDSTGRHEAI